MIVFWERAEVGTQRIFRPPSFNHPVFLSVPRGVFRVDILVPAMISLLIAYSQSHKTAEEQTKFYRLTRESSALISSPTAIIMLHHAEFSSLIAARKDQINMSFAFNNFNRPLLISCSHFYHKCIKYTVQL